MLVPDTKGIATWFEDENSYFDFFINPPSCGTGEMTVTAASDENVGSIILKDEPRINGTTSGSVSFGVRFQLCCNG
jgi:hypothetical protein